MTLPRRPVPARNIDGKSLARSPVACQSRLVRVDHDSQPEIADDDLPVVGTKQVRGLQIAVDYAQIVRMLHRAATAPDAACGSEKVIVTSATDGEQEYGWSRPDHRHPGYTEARRTKPFREVSLAKKTLLTRRPALERT